MTNCSASDLAGRRIREARQRHRWTVTTLAGKCAEAGIPRITPSVITNLETRRRGTRDITVDELLALARVLGVPPLQLILPVDAGEKLEVLPGTELDSLDATRWIAGEGAQDLARAMRTRDPSGTERLLRWLGSADVLTLIRLTGAGTRELARADAQAWTPGSAGSARHFLPVLADRLMHVAARMRDLGCEPPRMNEVSQILARHGLPSTLEEWRASAQAPAGLPEDDEDDRTWRDGQIPAPPAGDDARRSAGREDERGEHG